MRIPSIACQPKLAEAEDRISKGWSGKRDSNPQPTAWKAVALPIELFPRLWWREQDLNLRRHKPTDLQSVPFGRSGISPYRSKKRGEKPRVTIILFLLNVFNIILSKNAIFSLPWPIPGPSLLLSTRAMFSI